MSKSSVGIEAKLQMASRKEAILGSITYCLASCFPALGGAEDDAISSKVISHIMLNKAALEMIQDPEILDHLELLIGVIKELLDRDKTSPVHPVLLETYARIIHNSILLGDVEAQKILNKEDYIAVLDHAAAFLKKSNLENYQKLDESISRFGSLKQPQAESHDKRDDGIDKFEGEPNFTEGSPYYELVKKYCILVAHMAIVNLIASLTKATSLISILSSAVMPVAHTTSAVSHLPSSSTTPAPATSGENNLPSSHDTDEFTTSSARLKAQFKTIFDMNQRSVKKSSSQETEKKRPKPSHPISKL